MTANVQSLRTDRPVFIVGAPRSGTTLLASMIGAHPEFACGPETHFFNKLSKEQLSEAVDDPQWPTVACRLLVGLRLAEQPVHVLFDVDESAMRSFLAARPPTVTAMLEVFMLALLARSGKRRWAEKTPNHLLHLDRVIEAYPDATIVRIARDPRGVALSMVDLPWASRAPLVNAMLWADWYKRSQAYFAVDKPHCVTVRYEDLVLDPRGVLEQVSSAVGVQFSQEMLRFSGSAATISSANEVWKRLNTADLDASRAQRWRSRMPDDMAQSIANICAVGMADLGYDEAGRAERTFTCFPSRTRDLQRVADVLQARALQGAVCELSDGPSARAITWLLPAPRDLQLRRQVAWTGRRLLVWILRFASRRPTVWRL